MSDRVPMRRQGYERLEAELRRLKSEERPSVVKEIEEARAHGDLSENAEYAAAKEHQSHIEGRIRTVEDRLARAQVIEPGSQNQDAIRFGATILLEDTGTNERLSYTIVGEDEARISDGLISITSPVAGAVLGKEVGDVVTVRVPKGARELEVLEIRYD